MIPGMVVWRAGRPELPDGYGVTPEGPLLEWETVEERLRQAAHYWMSTTRPDGRPHVVPRWGVWVDAMLWYDGSPRTRHALNLGANPYCTLHLEDGAQATIVDGVSTTSRPVSGNLGERLSEEFRRKYAHLGYAPGTDAWSGEDAGGMRVFEPRKAIAWSRFPEDLTRFFFDRPT